MSKPQQIQVPPQMLQQLLRGPTPAQKAPDVVEVMADGKRLLFNLDALESVRESLDGSCDVDIKLKFIDDWYSLDMNYDQFLFAAKIQPRQLYRETDSGD